MKKALPALAVAAAVALAVASHYDRFLWWGSALLMLLAVALVVRAIILNSKR